ncbi:restriction endonuclease subunit S [Zunongwangia sp. HRR-M8]|uniref:restriction endonuclease subunit S n=1 Tax=Zunongwangia sp. HRR-M8 TaxID=3015170 RepID=UPI0022DD76B6|nr:restriction endonuclease subunit S [Zunongwangia sp. HRR-M8]WBL23545.1 restriction endonuclease subunit S [Zunongwangia sp. HRR-M8]
MGKQESRIGLNNLDKSNWKTYKFENIAQKVSKTIKPEEAEVSVYVGLEHIDAEDIHIRRKGVPADVKGGKLKCSPGDVIFGKRRAYQRKAAIVDFEGICSAHAFVFRAKPKVLLPELFPFFLHSDQFMHRMVDISVGGLSPTINWGDLKHQEFLLPPLDKQAELAELLWAMDTVIEREKKVLEHLEYQSKTYLNKSFRYGAFLNQKSKYTSFGPIPKNWKLKKLDELGKFKNGINKDKDQFGFGRPFVNLMDAFGNKDLFFQEFDLVNSTEEDLRLFNLTKGDVLFIRSSVKPSGVGLTTLIQEDFPSTVYSGFIIRFRTENDELTHAFKKYCFYEERFRYSLIRKSTVSANTNINQESLKKLVLPVPPIEEQKEFNRILSQHETTYKKMSTKISSSKALQKSLINQVF